MGLGRVEVGADPIDSTKTDSLLRNVRSMRKIGRIHLKQIRRLAGKLAGEGVLRHHCASVTASPTFAQTGEVPIAQHDR
eukprot:2753651-Pyramimonas_sp.AAC.1